MKKTRELELTAGTLTAGTEDMVPVKSSIRKSKTGGDNSHPVSLDRPQMKERINSRIHESLTDMWLLTTGEDFESEFFNIQKYNGRPIAVFCDGQMKLMESRPLTLDALRAVGIEMS